jgi:hypothetical protein
LKRKKEPKIMKLIASFAALSIALTIASVASAQHSTQPSSPTKAQPSQIKTNDYTEQNVGGDQVVKFTGDELVGPPNGFLGDSIRPLPGAIRVQLIRPRLNFVPELLKSVENL